MKPTVLNDFVTAVFCLIVGAIGTYATAYYPSDAGGFPRMLSLYFLIPLGALILIKGFFRALAHRKGGELKEKLVENSQSIQFSVSTLLVIVTVSIMTILIGTLGFIEAVAVLAVATGLIFKTKIWAIVVYAIAQSIFLWFFLDFFSIQMPRGFII